MTNWQKISLTLAFLTALFLSGIGVFIAESSPLGVLGCLFGAIMVPGLGFFLKRKFKNEA